MPEFDTRVGAYCVVVEDGHILLAHIRRDYFGSEYGWTLPGGGMEPNETPEQTARRELLEETGLEVELTGLLAVDSFTIRKEDRIAEEDRGRSLLSLRIIYSARRTGGSLCNEQDGSTDEVAWHDLAAVDTLQRVELVDVAVRAHTAGPGSLLASMKGHQPAGPI